MIQEFLLNKIINPDQYFTDYLNDITNVIKDRNDGGFEDPIRYYFASKILDDFSISHRIYTGNTPREGLIETTLFPQNNKPDLVTIHKQTSEVEIFELKTIVSKPFLYSFFFSSDGTERNYENHNGDFWKQKSRKEIARSNSINCNCYFLVFYRDSAQQSPLKWLQRYEEKVNNNELLLTNDGIFIENNQCRINYILLEIN